MTTVRIATQADEPDLLKLCKELHAENGFLFTMNEERVKETLKRAWDRQGGIVGVIDGNKEIEGAIFLLFSTIWYTDDWHIEELFNFIRPAYRVSKHAETLIEFAKNCQRGIGLPLMIGVLTNSRMEAKVRLYRRKLDMPAGAFFIYGGDYQNDTSNTDLWSLHTRNRKKNIPTTNGSSMPPMTLA